ncbi:MAG: 50S ribosomal protein L10 [Dehalococcoidia bacterium]|jgi:large subunit ribosomal protein L10
MPAPKKLQIVEELKDQIGRSTIAIGAEYQGLRVAEMNALRRQLGAKGIDLRVTKNTLLRLAAAAVDKPEVAALAEGPTAVIFGYHDVVEAAKAVLEYVQTAKNAFQPRLAYLEGRVISARELGELSSLPPRPILIGKLAGSLQGPVWRLAQLLASTIVQPTGQLLNSSLTQLQGLLEARAGQLEEA